MCHDSIPLDDLQLDLADLNGRIVLPVAPLNLVLVGLLELQNGELLRPALLHDLARDAGRRRIRSRHNLLVVSVYRQHGPEFHLLAHVTLDPLNTDGVARCDTILLSPGLYNGVHLSSKAYRQTIIIRGRSRYRQRNILTPPVIPS